MLDVEVRDFCPLSKRFEVRFSGFAHGTIFVKRGLSFVFCTSTEFSSKDI